MDSTIANRLIDLGTAALGVGCLIVSALVPVAAPVIGPVGGMLVGAALKRPSDMVRDRAIARANSADTLKVQK